MGDSIVRKLCFYMNNGGRPYAIIAITISLISATMESKEPSRFRRQSLARIAQRVGNMFLGLLLGAFTLICAIGTYSLIDDKWRETNVVLRAILVAMVAGCLWMLFLSIRLIFEIRVSYSFIGPRARRISSWLFILIPVAGLAAGFSARNPVPPIVAALFYLRIFFNLRRSAARMEMEALQKQLELDLQSNGERQVI